MIQPGTYKHFCGGTYTVLFVAHDASNARATDAQQVVVYLSLATGQIYTRPLEEFIQPVVWADDTTHPRFMRWHP